MQRQLDKFYMNGLISEKGVFYEDLNI